MEIGKADDCGENLTVKHDDAFLAGAGEVHEVTVAVIEEPFTPTLPPLVGYGGIGGG